MLDSDEQAFLFFMFPYEQLVLEASNSDAWETSAAWVLVLVSWIHPIHPIQWGVGGGGGEGTQTKMESIFKLYLQLSQWQKVVWKKKC